METGSKEGINNYIFFSYAHLNAKEAKAVIGSLRGAGHSVWYDDGVAPGFSWDDYIAEHIEHCRCFLAYVTEAYKNSANCIDEISYARDKGKEIVLIYAEDAENADFPKGLQMRLSAAKILRTSDHDNSASFYKALFETGGISASRTGDTVPNIPPQPEKKRKRSSRKKSAGKKIPLLPIALILVSIAFSKIIYNDIPDDTPSSQGVRCTIGEMDFTLPDDSYVKESDREKVFSNYRQLHIPARERGEEVMDPEDYIDIQWYNGQGNKYVMVTAQPASFSNDEFEAATDMIVLDKVGEYKEFRVGSAAGRYGIEKFDSFTNTVFQCLNNGIFYYIGFLNTELKDDEISAVIDSIDFYADLDDQTISCGDISLKIPGNYYEAESGWDDGRQDPHAYVFRTDTLKAINVCYYDSVPGRSASELAELYADYYGTDPVERDESFGKCHFLELVYEDNGTEYSEVMAMFEISGKTYAVELISDQPDITITRLEDILSTIEIS